MDLNFIYVLCALSQPHLRWGQSGTDVHGRMDGQSFEIPRIYGHHFGTEFGDLDSYSFLRCAVVLLGCSMRSRCFRRLFCSASSFYIIAYLSLDRLIQGEGSERDAPMPLSI